MQDYIYSLDFMVRDYECDLQGIVNNSVYQNYLEHTRHEFLKKMIGHDFAELAKEGITPVVFRAEIDYKSPLQSGNEFECKINVSLKGKLKIIFHQDIYRKSDNKIMVKGQITAVILKNGRPISSEMFIEPIKDKLI